MNLTDRLLKKSLKPSDKPYEVMDSDVRGLGIRVMPSGIKTFILFRRFPGSKNPARRALGAYPDISLAQAREKAREWNALVKKGIDPAIEEGRQEASGNRGGEKAASIYLRSRVRRLSPAQGLEA